MRERELVVKPRGKAASERDAGDGCWWESNALGDDGAFRRGVKQHSVLAQDVICGCTPLHLEIRHPAWRSFGEQERHSSIASSSDAAEVEAARFADRVRSELGLGCVVGQGSWSLVRIHGRGSGLFVAAAPRRRAVRA